MDGVDSVQTSLHNVSYFRVTDCYSNAEVAAYAPLIHKRHWQLDTA